MDTTAPLHTVAPVSPPPARPRRSLARRILRGVGFGVAGLVALVVLFLVFLQTPWGKSIVRGRIEAKLAAKVNGKVHVGSVDYSFLFRHVELGDVRITDAAGQPAISVGTIEVDLDRGSLLSGQPVIDDLAIRGLDVAVVQHADGTSNLTGLAKPSTGKPLARIQVRALSVAGAATITKPDGTTIAVRDLSVGGTVDARPATKELDLALRQLAGSVAITAPGKAPKQLALGIGSVKVGRRAAAVDIDVAGLAAGAVSIDTLGAHLRLDGKHLRGDQAITLGGVRVDSDELTALLGRPVLLQDLTVEAKVTGPENQLAIDGAVKTGGATLALTGTVDLSAPSRPSYQVALVGTGLRSDLVKSERPLPAVDTGVRIDLTGAGTLPTDLEAKLAIAIGPTTIGKVAVDGLTVHASATRGAYELESLHASAPGVSIDAGGALAVDRALRGTLTVKGEPARVAETLAAAGIVLPRRVPLPPTLELAVTATGNLDGTVDVTLAKTKLAVAGGTVSLAGTARLDHKKLATAHTTVGLRGIDLAAAARLAGKKSTLRGTASGTIDVRATATSRRADFDLAVALAEPALTVAVKGSAGETSATAHVVASRTSDKSVIATVDANVPLGKKAGKPALRPTGAWKVDADVEHRSLAELAALLPERLRDKLPAGDVEAHVALAGTPAQPTGTIDVTANVAKLAKRTQKVALHGTLSSTDQGMSLATTGTIWIDRDHDALATVTGAVAMPPALVGGKLDIKKVKAGATVDATIDIAERDLAALAYLRPKLAELGGKVVGQVGIEGPLATPRLDATIRLHGYPTASGGTGETTLTAAGTPKALTATIQHGDGVTITAAIDRSVANKIAVTAKARADKALLLPALPAMIGGRIKGSEPGALSWDMDGTFALVKTDAGMKLDAATLTGSLDITGGSIAVPRSERRWHDVGLRVVATPDGLAIESLSLHETDVEVKDRTLRASGLVRWDAQKPLKPATAHVDLVATNWLVFGTPALGQPDAPRATADFEIGVDADLAAPITTIDATVRALALKTPDRLDRGHQPEVASLTGDVIFVGPGSTPVGKLAAPRKVSSAPAAARKRRPMDIRIHIPDPVRLEQPPLSVLAHGELTVTVRDAGVATRGTLTMDGGNLNLFGRDHALVEGTVAFTDEHPHGHMALTFERPLPPEARRALSAASAGSGARVTFSGPPTKPKTSLSGAANAGLAEVMAMDNAGRPVYASAPDLPASATVQAPRGDQLFMLTFMASNLPHLLFLDRIDAYADPYDSANSYGRIEHVEAETYTEHSRVRAVMRPPTPGRSSAELQWDRLLVNDDQTAVGVGLRAGSRLGGGVGVFVEWSSKD